MEYLLITSQKGNWIFPKGVIERGETPEETASKEAYEEGGVRGRIVGPPVGSYSYEKWESECRVTVFLLEVERLEPSWPEDAVRDRAWMAFTEARAAVKGKKLREILEQANSRLS